MVTGVLADRKPVELHLFRNYQSPSELVATPYEHSGSYATPPPPQEQLVWKAARASGAAPSYFRSVNQCSDQKIHTIELNLKQGHSWLPIKRKQFHQSFMSQKCV